MAKMDKRQREAVTGIADDLEEVIAELRDAVANYEDTTDRDEREEYAVNVIDNLAALIDIAENAKVLRAGLEE